jgi:hypothetical protein
MDDPKANARHRVDSIKALDALADPGPQTATAADRFMIHIDLTADAKLKGIEPDPNDVIVIDATPRKTLATSAEESDGELI